MKITLKRGLIIVAIILVTIVGSVSAIYFLPNNWNQEQQIKTIEIAKNETGTDISKHLVEEGLIRSTWEFKLALMLQGANNKLQEGYYRIPNNISLHELIGTLQKGNVMDVKVTIPEGFTIRQIAERLQEEHVVSAEAFLAEARTFVPYMYMYGPQPVEYKAEGFLFPSTYEIPINSTPKDILTMMTSEMNRQLTPEIRARIKAKGMSIHDFITLASLVEREAYLDEDRPLIAAVFEKRLAINMPLQSCASIEYLLGTRKAVLSLADVQVESPYNTYLNTGLPPGAIANPGLKSMEAVLDAPKTEDLFFVADANGKHHFSKTYDEHLKIVESLYGK